MTTPATQLDPVGEEQPRGLVRRPVALVASDRIGERLAGLGRTEDVRLSPNGRRLAIACYAHDRIAVADVALESSQVRIERLELLSSPAVGEPHGVDFVDDDTLVVTGRRSGLAVFRLPAAEAPRDEWHVTPLLWNEAREAVDAPGSVVVRQAGAGAHELLVCVNWANEIRRFTLAGSLEREEVAVRKWLEVPDGVAVSADGAWIAVSNHFTHSVHVYDAARLGEDAEPVAVLRGATYPHGLRFAGDDRRLLVADAGAPYVHVFATGGSWHGASYSATAIRVMDDATFERARHNPQEGGPKGIDLDPRTSLLAVTSEATPLMFFDVSAELERPWEAGRDDTALLRYELDALAAREPTRAAAREAAAATESELRRRIATFEQSLTWRLTEPARRVYRSARRLVGR